MMKEIGGYFELEYDKGSQYHSTALALNTARNCLEYILRAKKYKKIFLPYYTCEVKLEPISKLKIDCEFLYDKNLNPIIPNTLHENDAFLYTNYFEIKQCFNSKQKLLLNSIWHHTYCLYRLTRGIIYQI